MLYAALSLAIVVCLSTVGILMSIAMLVVPASSRPARPLPWSQCRSMLSCSA